MAHNRKRTVKSQTEIYRHIVKRNHITIQITFHRNESAWKFININLELYIRNHPKQNLVLNRLNQKRKLFQ